MGIFKRITLSPKIKAAKLSGKFMGIDLFDMCECGEEVKPQDRQEISFYEEKHCFLRLCSSCIEKRKKVVHKGPAPENYAHLAPVG